MTSPSLTLDYLFDPLCGWCYASSAMLAGIASHYPDRLTLRPSGLFDAPRPVSAIAGHAWSNDQRIAAIAGLPLSTAYRDEVLMAPGGVFTSRFLTRALVALGQIDRGLEPRFLHRAQHARYVLAQDTSRPENVTALAETEMAEADLPFDAGDFARRLTGDADLAARAEARIAETNRLQQSLTAGVPKLVIGRDGENLILEGEAIYRGAGPVLAVIAEMVA
ncbi:protein-disulfide isomerase [Pararhodobacter marinus]|uniref:Protein-disulfide isomerase n=1 Tax=Pararhodobacter marinus TaxID=2184063 RepID=A0A2U2CI01_9RHOB|nr:protein-disulfide isomerase [Pararhodobacter marinus]PWE31506.1 protein-disulfide isomerase [Pararhodobacter marinus]